MMVVPWTILGLAFVLAVIKAMFPEPTPRCIRQERRAQKACRPDSGAVKRL